MSRVSVTGSYDHGLTVAASPLAKPCKPGTRRHGVLRRRYALSGKPLRRSYGMPVIRQAAASIQAATCLRFVSRTTQRDYVHIFPGKGCYSAVGRQGSQQLLSLGTGCLNKGTVVHELLHAAGFYHEHSRSDRDQYIVVFRQNVVPGYAFNFDKMQPWQHRLLTPFDRDSIMLYGSYAGSRAPGLYTMLAKDGTRLKEVPDKPGLSDSDARRIRILYQCP